MLLLQQRKLLMILTMLSLPLQKVHSINFVHFENDLDFPLEAPVAPSKDIWNIDEVPDSTVKIPDEVDRRPQPE